MTIVGFSYRNEKDLTVFENEEIQEIWNRNYMSKEDGVGLLDHIHMVVDIIELPNKSKELRLLTLFDSNEKKYSHDEEELEQIASLSNIYYDVDQNGKPIPKGIEDDETDYDDDYPRMKGDEDGFYSGKCKCGGIIFPMYDERPFWIAFCKQCDKRWENSDSSPLPY